MIKLSFFMLPLKYTIDLEEWESHVCTDIKTLSENTVVSITHNINASQHQIKLEYIHKSLNPVFCLFSSIYESGGFTDNTILTHSQYTSLAELCL